MIRVTCLIDRTFEVITSLSLKSVPKVGSTFKWDKEDIKINGVVKESILTVFDFHDPISLTSQPIYNIVIKPNYPYIFRGQEKK